MKSIIPYPVSYLVSKLIFTIAFFRTPLKVYGRENIPKGSVVICSNHAHGNDPFYIVYSFPFWDKIRIMAKEEIRHMPVVGRLLDFLGIPIWVKRGQSDLGAMKLAMKTLKKGDLVLLPFLEKSVDGYTPGWGAYSEYAVVGDAGAYVEQGMGPGTREWNESYLAQTVIGPGDKTDPVGAAMIATFREVLSAIRRFGFRANESVLIFGAGPVGLCFTRFCKLLGMKTVITTDLSDAKVEEAGRMGADYALNSGNCDIEQEVRRLCPEGVDNVVDAVGINALLNQAMGLIKYNGKVCGYGISPKLGMELDWSRAPYNWNLHFVQWPSKKEEGEAHAQVMAWINVGVLDPMDFISHTFSFEQILDAFALVERREPGTKKIVITF